VKLLIGWLINTVALMLVSRIIPGIAISDFWVGALAAAILVIFNLFLRPILVIATLPINLLTLGIFTLFINGFLFYLVSKTVSGFVVAGFWSAFWGALLFSVINYLLNAFFNPWKKLKVNFYSSRFQRGPRSGQVIDAEIVEEKREPGKLNRGNK